MPRASRKESELKTEEREPKYFLHATDRDGRELQPSDLALDLDLWWVGDQFCRAWVRLGGQQD